jgi:hypothetical protein
MNYLIQYSRKYCTIKIYEFKNQNMVYQLGYGSKLTFKQRIGMFRVIIGIISSSQ